MANLQQCLLHYSVQPPQPRRRRRKRNKGKKTMAPLNNSIIQELGRSRSTTGSNTNNNLIRINSLGTPRESIVKAAVKESALRSTVEKSALQPIVEKSALKSNSEKSPLKPTVETPAVKPTIGKLTINPEFQKLTASESYKTSLVNQTIDLSGDESSNEAFNWTYSGDNKPCVKSKQDANLIDLSEDVPDENEIILLNDNSKSFEPNKKELMKQNESNSPNITPSENKIHVTCFPNAKSASKRPLKSQLPQNRSENKSPASKSPERKRRCITPPEYEQPKIKPASSPHADKFDTVVIDISDDENENNAEMTEKDADSTEKDDTNDEVLVIGTFNKTSKPNAKSSKKVPKKKVHTKHNRKQLKKLLDVPTEHPKENPKEGSNTSVRRQEAVDVGETSSGNTNPKLVKLRRRIKAKYFTKILQNKKKMEIDILDTIKYQNLFLNNTLSGTELASGVGGNVYINAPVFIPSSGPRPIMIDGSNVAFTSDNPYKFSCKRLNICIKYFKEKGHKVTAFVPQFRLQSNQSDDPGLLDQLVRSGDVVLTPSKVIDGKLIVPYDDRFIVQAAVLKGGVIISRDNFKDLLEENPAWAETIKYRTLAYTWVDDVLMFPSDPLGVVGPSLEEFLSFN